FITLVCNRAIGWRRLVAQIRSRNDVNITTAGILSDLIEICEHALPARNQRKYCAPWWTPELTRLMRTAKRWKKRYRRVTLALKELYYPMMKQAQIDFDNAVMRSKFESWRTFVSNQTRESVWSQVYRV